MSSPRENESDEQRVEEAQEALAKLICHVAVSPRSFFKENGLFKPYVNAINPDMCSIFDFSLERKCLELFEREQNEVKEIFSKLGQISLSMDLQKRFVSMDEYVCLTAHFIVDDWKLRRWVIKYCSVFDKKWFRQPPHSAILKSLKEYDFEDKLLTLTTVGDYTGYSHTADSVKDDVQNRRDLLLNGRLFHVQCCCDLITRMVKMGFQEIDEIISKVQLLRWNESFPLWYLTSYKLYNALELNALGKFSSELHGVDCFNDEVPSEEEWEKVRSVCKIADKFYQITSVLFQVKRPTSNLFLPHLQEIRVYLGREVASPDAFMRRVAQKMLKIFDKYWDDMYLVLSIAAFLDPRYKMKFVEFCLSDVKAAFVLGCIRKVYDGYAVQCDAKKYQFSNSRSESSEEEEGYNFLLETLKVVQEYCRSIQFKPQKSDLDLYLEEPVLPWMSNFSVLHWWKDNSARYPQLSRMARDFLAIPISLATSYDDAYFTVPREADSTLLSLKPELMNALKCTRTWKLCS